MSRNTTAARRIALLASSSLGLAAIASAASLSVALTPTKAHAANECGDPLANGPAADEFICPTGPYPGGIDYSTTSGDLTLILQDRVDAGLG